MKEGGSRQEDAQHLFVMSLTLQKTVVDIRGGNHWGPHDMMRYMADDINDSR